MFDLSNIFRSTSSICLVLRSRYVLCSRGFRLVIWPLLWLLSLILTFLWDGALHTTGNGLVLASLVWCLVLDVEMRLGDLRDRSRIAWDLGERDEFGLLLLLLLREIFVCLWGVPLEVIESDLAPVTHRLGKRVLALYQSLPALFAQFLRGLHVFFGWFRPPGDPIFSWWEDPIYG